MNKVTVIVSVCECAMWPIEVEQSKLGKHTLIIYRSNKDIHWFTKQCDNKTSIWFTCNQFKTVVNKPQKECKTAGKELSANEKMIRTIRILQR